MKPTVAIVEQQHQREIDIVQKTWTKYQQAKTEFEQSEEDFADALISLRDKFARRGSRNDLVPVGQSRGGFRQVLADLGIPKSTAYRIMEERAELVKLETLLRKKFQTINDSYRETGRTLVEMREEFPEEFDCIVAEELPSAYARIAFFFRQVTFNEVADACFADVLSDEVTRC